MNSQPCNSEPTEPLSPIPQEPTHGQPTNDTSARPLAVHNSAMWEVTPERLQRIERILDSLPRQSTNSLRLHVPDSEALPPPTFPSQTDYSEPPSQYFARNSIGQSLNLSSHLESLRCFSSRSPDDYMAHETRLQQRISYQKKVRLGYDKAIAVLLLELERRPEYEPVHRSVVVDQPDTVFGLRSLSTDFEIAKCEDIARVLVDIIGSQRACHILENANIGEIPPLHYPAPQISVEMPKSSAHSRSLGSSERGAENPSFMFEPSSSNSASNNTPKTSSRNSTIPLLPSSSVREADGCVTKPRPPRPPKALEMGREPIDNDAETHHHASSGEISGDLYPRAPRPLLSDTQMEVDARTRTRRHTGRGGMLKCVNCRDAKQACQFQNVLEVCSRCQRGGLICSEKVYGREKTELIKGGLATLKNRLDFVQLPVQNERKRRKCSIQGDASRGTAPNRYLYDCPYLISGDSLRSTAKEGHIAGQFPASLNPSTGTSESASIQPPSAIWDFTDFAVSESQVAIAAHEATWTFSHVRPALNSGRLITRDARSFNDDSRLTNNVGRIDEFFPSNETFDEDGHLDPI